MSEDWTSAKKIIRDNPVRSLAEAVLPPQALVNEREASRAGSRRSRTLSWRPSGCSCAARRARRIHACYRGLFQVDAVLAQR